MASESQYEGINVKMETIFKKTLPDSLVQLSKRNESFNQIVNHLESEYVRSGSDKATVEKEAKTFIAKGLQNILQDIEFSAININNLVDLQATTVDSLATQIDVVQSRLSTLKSQHLLYGLDEMRASSVAKSKNLDSTTGGHENVAIEDFLPVSSSVPSHDNSMRSEDETNTEGDNVALTINENKSVYKRVPLAERLSKLSHVGLGSGSTLKQ